MERVINGETLSPQDKQALILESRRMEEVASLITSMIQPGTKNLSIDGLTANNANIQSAETGNGSVVLDEDGVSAAFGAVIIGEDGIVIPDAGDAISLQDSVSKSFSKITSYRGGLRLRTDQLGSLTDLVANGSFSTGDFTDWTVTDSNNKLSVVETEIGYAVKAEIGSTSSNAIEQSMSVAEGLVVSFKARMSIPGAAGVVGVDNGTGTFIETEAIQSDEWRNYSVTMDKACTTLKFTFTATGSGELYVTDFVAQARPALWPQAQIRLGVATMYLEGAVNINSVLANVDTKMSGTSDSNLIFLDASENKIGFGTNAPTDKIDVNSDTMRLRTAKTPTGSSDSSGNTGSIAWDSNYIYVKTGAGAWKRAALSTF